MNEAIICFEKNPNEENILAVAQTLKEYQYIVDLLVSFDHLSFALQSLIGFLQSLKEETFQTEDLNLFVSILLALLKDLESWRDSVFTKQDAVDIHYLDASLLSSCLQIEAIFEKKESDVGDELEFF